MTYVSNLKLISLYIFDVSNLLDIFIF
jgi:hypothetical protein